VPVPLLVMPMVDRPVPALKRAGPRLSGRSPKLAVGWATCGVPPFPELATRRFGMSPRGVTANPISLL
jgi:hypothetical protein